MLFRLDVLLPHSRLLRILYWLCVCLRFCVGCGGAIALIYVVLVCLTPEATHMKQAGCTVDYVLLLSKQDQQRLASAADAYASLTTSFC
jgi:hypothetical protein